jgi:hypothetical protein
MGDSTHPRRGRCKVGEIPPIRDFFFAKIFLLQTHDKRNIDNTPALRYNISMKMTIVIDSEDTKGIEAALTMTKLMYTKYVSAGGGQKESFGKIEFIKMLRKFMKESIEHLNDEDSNQVKDIGDMGNLRNAKRFADRIFRGER